MFEFIWLPSGNAVSFLAFFYNSHCKCAYRCISTCYLIWVFSEHQMIMERKFQPVIIFSFSRRECEQHAMSMAKLDFNTQEEKETVEHVFRNAILCLSEEDRELPAIELMLPLLQRGIAVHHSGLLPVIKELVEILFQEGLVKALFATETVILFFCSSLVSLLYPPYVYFRCGFSVYMLDVNILAL